MSGHLGRVLLGLTCLLIIYFDSALMLLTLLYYGENGNLFRLRCLKQTPKSMLRHINRSSLIFSNAECSGDASVEENALCTKVHY